MIPKFGKILDLGIIINYFQTVHYLEKARIIQLNILKIRRIP